MRSFLLFSISFSLFATVGVRLSDLGEYAPSTFSEAELLDKRISRFPNFYFGTYDAKSHLNFLIESPITQANGEVQIKIASIVEYALGNTVDASKWNGRKAAKFDSADIDNRHEIHILEISYNRNASTIDFQIKDREIIDLSDTRFEIKVGLRNRRTIIQDTIRNELKFVLPVGVGALDLGISRIGVYKSMTPIYIDQQIDTDLNQVSWAHRDDQTYYQNKPFIRFRTNKSEFMGWSTIGFHIQQNRIFRRGFDSHGCMRLRAQDLDALFRITMHTQKYRNTMVRASILPRLNDNELDHPMPKSNNSIKIVKNFGSHEFPEKGLDELNLTAITTKKIHPFELVKILDKLENDYHNRLFEVVDD